MGKFVRRIEHSHMYLIAVDNRIGFCGKRMVTLLTKVLITASKILVYFLKIFIDEKHTQGTRKIKGWLKGAVSRGWLAIKP